MPKALRQFVFATLLAGAIPVLAGCEGNGGKPAEEVTVTGTRTGTAKAGGQTAAMTMTTTQSGNAVTGTYSIAAPISESGTVTGSLLGLIFNFTLTRTLPTAATFSSSVDVSNGSSHLVGSFGNGLYTYDLTKQ